VVPRRLADVIAEGPAGGRALADLVELLADHAAIGSERARKLLADRERLPLDVWLVEPISARAAAPAPSLGERREPVVAAIPDRNRGASRVAPTPAPADRTLTAHVPMATE
ncbi:MAG: hypothetical protein ACYDCI_13740, partial [Candidatus Limnocylindrales bacterium]